MLFAYGWLPLYNNHGKQQTHFYPTRQWKDSQFVLGVSSYKQAFSIGVPNSLLVRRRLCCCRLCLDRKFGECKNKVNLREILALQITCSTVKVGKLSKLKTGKILERLPCATFPKIGKLNLRY